MRDVRDGPVNGDALHGTAERVAQHLLRPGQRLLERRLLSRRLPLQARGRGGAVVMVVVEVLPGRILQDHDLA